MDSEGAQVTVIIRAECGVSEKCAPARSAFTRAGTPDTIRAIDALFISHERYDRKGTTAFLDVPPDLIVEILSPGNTWADTIQKLREFFSIGVRLVWLVDPSSQSVFAYRALTDVREFTIDNHLPGDDVLPGFSVAIREIFAG